MHPKVFLYKNKTYKQTNSTNENEIEIDVNEKQQQQQQAKNGHFVAITMHLPNEKPPI